LIKRMLEKNMFLFGFVDLHKGSISETVKQLTELQDAHMQLAYKMFPKNDIIYSNLIA